MVWDGQASGEWTESSAYLRELYKGHHDSIGDLVPAAFTQANPPTVTTVITRASMLVGVTKVGVLSGSVAFTRPDVGNNFLGGPNMSASAANLVLIRPLGMFLNDSVGHDYENTPGVASGKGPYVMSFGTYGTRLFETQAIYDYGAGGITAGDALTYVSGQFLYASANGYVTNNYFDSFEYRANLAAGGMAGSETVTTFGVCVFAPESDMYELVFNLRV